MTELSKDSPRSELKTLKDLHQDCDGCYSKECEGIVSYYELRLEAIKWIKALIDRDNHSPFICSNFENESANCSEVINWIMHFFGITEDDLKYY